MAFSYVTYTGNGATTNFAVPFSFISRDNVAVTVDGVAVSFSWLSDGMIQCAVAPANGTLVEVRRVTQKSAPLVDFEDASTLTESDLDLFSLQMLYIAQEAYDALDGAMALDDDGNYDAVNRRIVRVTNPTSAQDAATKSYVDGQISTGAANAAAAAAAQSLAEGAKTAAEAVYDSFDDRYLGAKTSNPTTDNDGGPLVAGALYFNTPASQMRVWTGSAWQVAYNPALGAVDSVFGRTGGVVANNGDYTASQITNVPRGNLAATTVQAALNELDSEKAAVSHTHTAAQISDSTAAGQALLTAADASAQRSALGLGALATLASAAFSNIASSAIATAAEYLSNTASKLISVASAWSAAAPVALTDGATITPNFSGGVNFTVTLAGNRTLANPSNQKAGQAGVIAIKQDATGSRTLSYGANFKFPGGTAPVLSTAANAVDLLYYFVEANGTIHASLAKGSA
jgi:hypothetical protein